MQQLQCRKLSGKRPRFSSAAWTDTEPQNLFLFFLKTPFAFFSNTSILKDIDSDVAQWCNGSTTDSGSVCWGSNPYWAAIFFVSSTILAIVLNSGIRVSSASFIQRWKSDSDMIRCLGSWINSPQSFFEHIRITKLLELSSHITQADFGILRQIFIILQEDKAQALQLLLLNYI